MRIGVFDSGLGGVAITRELRQWFPQYEFVVLVDGLNFPYGTKSDTDLVRIIEKNIGFLERLEVDLILVACNTASWVIEKNQIESHVPIVTVIDLTARYAQQTCGQKKLLVLATTATIMSNIYVKKLSGIGNEVETCDSQQLVFLVESGDYDSEFAKNVVAEHLRTFLSCDFAGIILGCTHFILLKDIIQSLFSKSRIISPIEPLRHRLAEILTSSSDKRTVDSTLTSVFITKNDPLLANRVRRLLGKPRVYMFIDRQIVNV